MLNILKKQSFISVGEFKSRELLNIMNTKLLILASTLCVSSMVAADKYQADWESLSAHKQAPEWFKDAKFGIYFHWGPYSVPAFGNEHYPRTMYGHPSGKKPVENKQKRNYNLGVGFQTFREHEHHKAVFGEPKDFEYHDLIPKFTATNFNAEDWADLFYLSGAKFAGPVAEHHDGYAMWDSALTPWNAADTGPKRDVVGEMAKAIRKRDMKFITTFHHAKGGDFGVEAGKKRRQWHYYGREQYMLRQDPSFKDSPELQKLYGSMPRQEWLGMWNGKLEEVIDNYQPDMIWFDSWLDRIPEKNRQAFAAYYLNAAKSWDKEVMITYKQEDMPQSVGVVDFEKGRLDKSTSYSWLTDDTISAGTWTTTGSWSYTEELDIKSSKEIIHTLIDIVSKNGQLLLNISPKANGVIPQAQKDSLLGVGKWLRANGEAIYNTRPFKVYGEGPKRLKSSGHFVEMDGAYNQENIRFTTKGNSIYAIQMGWPGSHKKVLIKSLSKEKLGELSVSKVSVVDSPEKINWQITDQGLEITAPFKAPNKVAISYKIETN
jgi:alpha-L-fucosidase